MRFRARAPRLGQPGLFPDRGDQRHPSRSGRRLGLVPARLRHPAGAQARRSAPRIIWPRADYERRFRRLALAHEALFKPIAQAMFQGIGCDPHAYDAQAHRHQFRAPAELLPADERGRRTARAPAGCSATRMSTCSRSCRRRASRACRCGTIAAGKWVRLSAPPRLDHHQHRRLHAADLERSCCPRPPTASASPATARIWPRRAFPSRSTSMSGRTRCWRCCPASGTPRYDADQGHHLPHAQHQQILRRRLRGSGLGLPKNDKWYIVYRYHRVVWSVDRCPATNLPHCPSPTSFSQVLIVLNWIYGALLLAILGLSLANEHWTFMALGVPVSDQTRPLVMGMRAIAALGLLTVPLNLAMLKRLVAMVHTVRAGDPFVAANANRLQAIAWVLLALQLISLVIWRDRQGRLDARSPAAPRCRLFDRRLARRDPDLRPRARVRRRHADARRPRRDGVTWPSPSSSTTCSTSGG